MYCVQGGDIEDTNKQVASGGIESEYWVSGGGVTE